MIMTVHPVLVLVPIFGLLVLPCAPMHLKNGFKIVFNTTVGRPDDCDLKLCPEIESCSMALLNEDQSQLMCYLISCPNDTQNSSCGNVTKISELLAETESDNVDNNSTRELVPLQGSSGTNSSQSSPDDSSSNTTQPSASEANVSIFTTSTITKPTNLQNNLTTTVTNLLTNSTEKSATADAVPKPANSEAIPTPPAKTSTITTTPKPTTTSPKPSSATTSTTTTTTVAQTIIPKHPSSPSPSGTNSSVIISPLVPTSNSSSKPVQTPPIPTSSDGKPMRTTPKTSMSPSVVTSKLPKDIPKRDQAIVDVAGDSLTSHLLNTSSLLAVLFFGLLFFVVTVALFLKQAYESYKRKDYTQVDYLINGMYSDSGV